MADVRFTNNSDEVRAALREKIPVALEAIGLKAEGYAKRMAPVDTGRLRNSITHTVSDDTAVIGTNVLNDPPKMVHRSTKIRESVFRYVRFFHLFC